MLKMFKKKKKAQHYKSKPKMEFSKKWLIACIAISLFYTTLSYILAWFDKNTVEALTIEVLNLLWGTSGISFVGYALQNCVRAFTASKFGIPRQKEMRETEQERIFEQVEEIEN